MFEHKGIKIDIDQHGNFLAKHEDLDFSAKTLEEVKRKIDAKPLTKRLISLPVIGIPEYSYRTKTKDKAQLAIVKANITGINRTTRVLQYDELDKSMSGIDHVMADTEANIQLLKDYQEAAERYRELGAKVAAKTLKVNGYGRIDPDQYSFVLKELEESHARSKAQSKEIK